MKPFGLLSVDNGETASFYCSFLLEEYGYRPHSEVIHAHVEITAITVFSAPGILSYQIETAVGIAGQSHQQNGMVVVEKPFLIIGLSVFG